MTRAVQPRVSRHAQAHSHACKDNSLALSGLAGHATLGYKQVGLLCCTNCMVLGARVVPWSMGSAGPAGKACTAAATRPQRSSQQPAWGSAPATSPAQLSQVSWHVGTAVPWHTAVSMLADVSPSRQRYQIRGSAVSNRPWLAVATQTTCCCPLHIRKITQSAAEPLDCSESQSIWYKTDMQSSGGPQRYGSSGSAPRRGRPC